ncbi:hypothetical protein V8B97DRAFT_813543 [Scleroderma yunnanense]
MSTTAQLKYSLPPPDGSRPYTDVKSGMTTEKRSQNWLDDIHDVQIKDIRGKEDKYTLDTVGFQYYCHPAKHTTFLNDKEIKEEYYPESMELIKKLTGATKVVVFGHIVRRRRPVLDNEPMQYLQPASNVHVDQTTPFAISIAYACLPAREAYTLLQGRFQIINLWRPISHPAVDWPLALCDFRSINTERDLMPVTLLLPDREGETYCMKYDPGHQWIYKSAMDPEDLVLFKCFDSIEDGSVARMAPRTAFEDPKTPEGAPFLESIELRALVFYEEV